MTRTQLAERGSFTGSPKQVAIWAPMGRTMWPSGPYDETHCPGEMSVTRSNGRAGAILRFWGQTLGEDEVC